MENLGWKVPLIFVEFRKSIVQEGMGQRERIYERQFLSVSFRHYVRHDTRSSNDDFHFLWQFLNANLKFPSMNNPV